MIIIMSISIIKVSILIALKKTFSSDITKLQWAVCGPGCYGLTNSFNNDILCLLGHAIRYVLLTRGDFLRKDKHVR